MPASTEYSIPVGALFALRQLLPTASWYADEHNQQAKLIVHGVGADEAIGELPPAPERQPDEPDVSFAKRVKAWAEAPRTVSWTDKQRDAVKVCVQYYLKKGIFVATPVTVRLLTVLGLCDGD